MTLHEFVIMAQDGLIGLVLILLGLIRIPKVDLNLWTIIARVFGRAMNGDMIKQINKIDNELDAHIKKTEETRIKQARQRILRFSDDIMLGKNHSLEHYSDIIDDIDIYEEYCNGHPDYVNNKAKSAIKLIRETYEDHLHHNSFLTYHQNNN